MKYAQRTSVSAAKTRDEIEATIGRYGADQYAFAQTVERAVLQFALTKPHRLVVRFNLPLAGTSQDGSMIQLTDQQMRQRWRALLLTIKAKLEAVESGIETIEHAFLAEIVLPNGRTMAEWTAPQLQTMIENGHMPTALLEFSHNDVA